MSAKKVFISHASALEFWRHHDLSRAGGIKRIRRSSLRGATSSVSAIRSLVRSASPTSGKIFGARPDASLSSCLHDLQIEELPLHVMVDTSNKREKRGSVITHLYRQPLPEGSLCRISENVYVASPELTLCQMATLLPPVDVLELCLEFCSGYCLNSENERGFDDRPALTSSSRLATFVRRFKGRHGVKQIRSLLPYVVDDSASPMESVVLMLLCLPSRLGGRQLPIPEHNVAIPITERARSHTRRKTLVCDLFWKEYRLDAECDSTRHHTSKRQLGIDSNRRIILDAMEYKYVGITRWQLESEDEFEDVVQAIRRAMGLPLRSTPKHVRDNRNALREYLVASHGSRQPLKLV